LLVASDRPSPMRSPSLPRACALALAGALVLPASALAQTMDGASPAPAPTAPTAPTAPALVPVAPALPTGFFFRVAAAATSFNLDGLTFRQVGVPTDGTPRAMSPGKDFLHSGVLPGVSLALAIDTAWFYVRVGVDEYVMASPVRPDQDDIRHVTLGWGSVGGRLVLGHFALLAGVRLGALVVGLTHQASPGHPATDYDAISGVYAADVGFQWRPTRWLQLDVSLGQDFGSLLATTASLGASFGWSRSPPPRL